LNFNFAKAYPAKVQKKICETAIEIEIMNEIAIAREIFAYWKITSKVTGSWSPRVTLGGFLAISFFSFDATTSIHQNGKTTKNVVTPRVMYAIAALILNCGFSVGEVDFFEVRVLIINPSQSC
jgi:hypothetical protein